MRRYPEWATYVGDNRYGDKLFDATREGEAADYARARSELAAAKAIARDRLAPTDQVSLDIFIYELESQLRMERFVGFRRLSLGSQGGFQSSLSQLLRASPVGDAARRRADPGAPGRVSAPARSGARVPARRHGARLGAAAHGARARPRAARSCSWCGARPGPVLRALRPPRQRHPRAGAGRPAGAGAAHASPTTCVPAVRRLRAFVADEYLPQVAGRRRARRLSRRRRRLRRAGAQRRRPPTSRRRRSTRSACARSSGCAARWKR